MEEQTVTAEERRLLAVYESDIGVEAQFQIRVHSWIDPIVAVFGKPPGKEYIDDGT